MPKRILTGKVTSNKADKTITVLVERKIMHPMYKKFVTKSKKFAAHDIENKFKVGDHVFVPGANCYVKEKGLFGGSTHPRLVPRCPLARQHRGRTGRNPHPLARVGCAHRHERSAF